MDSCLAATPKAGAEPKPARTGLKPCAYSFYWATVRKGASQGLHSDQVPEESHWRTRVQ
jgi:hypothetical protein